MTIEFILRVLRLFEDSGDLVWWRTDGQYAPVTFFANCNDLFYWACADSQRITPENIAVAEQAKRDMLALIPPRQDSTEWAVLAASREAIWPLLFCCRARGMRPQAAYYEHLHHDLHALFDAAGPVRTDPDGRKKS